jgi:hypothetical protein
MFNVFASNISSFYCDMSIVYLFHRLSTRFNYWNRKEALTKIRTTIIWSNIFPGILLLTNYLMMIPSTSETPSYLEQFIISVSKSS